MVRASRTPYVLALFACVVGCDDSGYHVRLTFDEGVAPSTVRYIELLVLPECPSAASVASGEPPTGTIHAGVGLAQTDEASLPAIGRLDPGSYGLYARGFDSSCMAVAAGCAAVSLERGGEDTLVVELGATAVVDACASDGVCMDGRCVDAAPDGGPDGSATDMGTCTLLATADGSVRGGGVGPASSGTDSTMNTSWSSAAGFHRSYVAFDLGGTCQEGGTIPPGATVSSATLTLRLSTDCACSADAHELNRVTSSWTQDDLSAGAEPSASGTSATFSAPAANGEVVIGGATLTSDVQAFLDGTPNHGWRIRQSESASGNDASPYRWATLESPNPPELEVVWTVP